VDCKLKQSVIKFHFVHKLLAHNFGDRNTIFADCVPIPRSRQRRGSLARLARESRTIDRKIVFHEDSWVASRKSNSRSEKSARTGTRAR